MMILKMSCVILNSWSVIFIRITLIFNDLYYKEKLCLLQWKIIFIKEKIIEVMIDHFPWFFPPSCTFFFSLIVSFPTSLFFSLFVFLFVFSPSFFSFCLVFLCHFFILFLLSRFFFLVSTLLFLLSRFYSLVSSLSRFFSLVSSSLFLFSGFSLVSVFFSLCF